MSRLCFKLHVLSIKFIFKFSRYTFEMKKPGNGLTGNYSSHVKDIFLCYFQQWVHKPSSRAWHYKKKERPITSTSHKSKGGDTRDDGYWWTIRSNTLNIASEHTGKENRLGVIKTKFTLIHFPYHIPPCYFYLPNSFSRFILKTSPLYNSSIRKSR